MPEINFTDLVQICGGILIAIYALFQAFIKVFGNVGVLKKRKDEKEAQENIKREKECREQMGILIEELVIPIVNDIKKANINQDESLKQLKESSNDMLRREIANIYYKYLPYKKIPRYTKEELFHLVGDYQKQGGNSFVEEIFEEMKTWEIVQTEEDIGRKSK